jgi:hypothetical protein
MRRFLVSLVAVGAMTLQPAFAQIQCKSAADQATFEVLALRSELMVLAMGCHDDDQYNAFMHKYQPDLQANEKAIDAYFKRAYGRSAQTEHDRFVTDLANAVSRQGTGLGGDFCPRNGAVFSEVMALPRTTELAEYAAGKDLVPPSLEICTVQAVPVRAPARKAEIKTAKR